MPDKDPFELCGTTIDGKYRVLSVVGEGGFGVVYKGVHAGFEAPIAVKCLKLPPHFDRAAQEALVQQLREEGRLLLRLSQRTPGILQALDVGSFTTPSGARVPFLILEWLDGRTLAEELKSRRGTLMSLREAFDRLDPAARALAVAHDEKIAHRDIKPENLFCITSGGKPSLKILDFGIAKILGDAATPTSGTQMGALHMFTPNYAAPEQFDKKRGATGPWSDVFAFALVFVEMCAGQPALEGNSVFELFHAASNPASRPTLRARGVAAPEPVERVLEKALDPLATGRYPDLGSFWKALGDAVRDSGAASLPPFDPAGAGVGVDADPNTFENARTLAASPSAMQHGTAPRSIAGTPSRGAGGAAGAVPPTNVLETGAGTTSTPATRIEATTTEKSPVDTKPRPSAARWVGLGLAALAGAGALAVVGGALRAGSHHGASSASAAVSAAPPVSSNPAAAALYHEAMQSWHDGALDPAIRGMEQAVSLDRELGAAHLRLALWQFMAHRQPEGREHYKEAFGNRKGLDAMDSALVVAIEPYMRQPWDLEAWGKNIEELTRKLPDSAELLVYLGTSQQARFQPGEAIKVYKRALQKDPALVMARVMEAESLSMKGDVGGQLEAYEECLEASPLATQCLLREIALHAQTGACSAMKAEAERLLSIDPGSAVTQRQFALALNATGAPPDAVREVLGRSWVLETDANRKVVQLQDQAALAALAGNFAEAEKRLEEWQAAVSERPDRAAHAAPALRLADLYTEMGSPRKASDIADTFLRLKDAWSEPATEDYTVLFLAYRLRTGAVSREDYEKARAETKKTMASRWTRSGRKLDDDFEWLAWSETYGEEVATEADAKAALEAMPKVPSPAVDSGRWAQVDLAVGRAQALAGTPAKALAPLRRAASQCLTLTDPVTKTWAELSLGIALERTGDKDGARDAYRKVLARWGKATPTSVTAAEAKKRLAALGDKH